MTIHVRNAAGDMTFTIGGWEKLLQIAEDYGWEPQGTIHPHWAPEEVQEERGGYLTSDFQYVTDEDALNLAMALEQALVDMPDTDEAKKYDVAPPEFMAQGIMGFDPDNMPSPIEWFSGSRKQKVREFIAFCKAGGFTIS
jgi:hypothetical protein